MVLLVALIGAVVLAMPGAALATTGHTFAGQFGGSGTGDGQFGSAVAVAVMPSTGEVFTASDSAPRVQRFGADGVFQSSFMIDGSFEVPAVAVDPAGFGAVYVLDSAIDGIHVLKYSAAGVFAHQLDAASSGTSLNLGAAVGCEGLAVDPVDGTVYVGATDNNTGGQVIARFNGSTGAFTDSLVGVGSPDGSFQCPQGLAVDGSHRLYVLDNGRVDRYDAAGTFEATVDSGSSYGPPTAVAVNPVSDEVYVSKPGPRGVQVAHLTAGGAAPVYTFDATGVGGVGAMSVSGLGAVYIADTAASPFVKRFVQFDGPTVETVAVSSPSPEPREATLEGTIDPEGVDSAYHFEYGLDETYGSSTPESDPVSGSDPVAALGAITGLKPNTTYHYRIVGSNGLGSIMGADQSFTTATAPPTVSTSFASAITPRTARVHGFVNPSNNGFVGWRFEYGTTLAYGTTASAQYPGNNIFGGGGDDLPVALGLAGLEPGTVYHYRVVAEVFGLGGPQFGEDQTFITSPAAAAGATDLTTRRATLKGTVNPHGQATTYYFNYGPTADYGASTQEVDAGSGDGDQQVTQPVTGLEPSTVYHVQVVAKTGDVTRFGADGLFETPPAPTATATSPTGISTDSATLAGNVETHGQTGTYHFEVSSLDSDYSVLTPTKPASGNASTEHITAPITGLPRGEVFVVELTVESNEAIAVSDQVTFATVPLPRVFPNAPTSSLGCKAPRLDAYNRKPKPGDTIKITGSDLGIGGDAVLGDRSLVPADWTATGFNLEIPDDAAGTLGLTVNCGHRSNTIAIAIAGKPNVKFSIRKQAARAGVVTLSVKVPGPGKLTTVGANTKTVKTTVRKAGRATIKVKLTRAGRKALKSTSNGALRIATRVRFTPAGGKPAIKRIVLTFKRAGR